MDTPLALRSLPMVVTAPFPPQRTPPPVPTSHPIPHILPNTKTRPPHTLANPPRNPLRSQPTACPNPVGHLLNTQRAPRLRHQLPPTPMPVVLAGSLHPPVWLLLHWSWQGSRSSEACEKDCKLRFFFFHGLRVFMVFSPGA